MKTYSIDDLQIFDDPVGLILRRPEMYLGGLDRVAGEYLAARMLGDLVWLRALPARVNRAQQWWEVSSATDWLAGPSGMGLGAFTQIVPFPAAGQNSFHSEILLTAFADAVATSGADGVAWIKGDRNSLLPSEIALDKFGAGRIVIFSIKNS
jgi:hypothetical protein